MALGSVTTKIGGCGSKEPTRAVGSAFKWLDCDLASFEGSQRALHDDG